jgi:hypothetical protein
LPNVNPHHKERNMIDQAEAEKLATAKLQEYVNACHCDTLEDVGNVLMKFLSVTGQAILATQGQATAVAMVEGTARHLAKPEFSKPYKMEKLQ